MCIFYQVMSLNNGYFINGHILIKPIEINIRTMDIHWNNFLKNNYARGPHVSWYCYIMNENILF